MKNNGFKKLLYISLITLFVSVSIISIQKIHAETKDVVQTRKTLSVTEFPESYQPGLLKIQEKFPNASFVCFDTGLKWDEVLSENNEMKYGRNLVPVSSQKEWKNQEPDFYNEAEDTYTQIEPGWVQASKAAVEYYLDPRNSFNTQDIFQFLSMKYDNSQTVEGVAAILSGTFMDGKMIVDNDGKETTYAQSIYDIGKETGVSPYLLACRIVQEQGVKGTSSLISGEYAGFEGYYNFFNIGAYGSTNTDIITNGLTKAKDEDWSTEYKAIVGGANFLKEKYVDTKKDTLYLQHFNVVADEEKTVSYRPYMTNLYAPKNETKKMSCAFFDKTLPYTFIIPVYDEMPEEPIMYPDFNMDGKKLKTLTVKSDENDILNGFQSDVFEYELPSVSSKTICLSAEPVSNESRVEVNGKTFENSIDIPVANGFGIVEVKVFDKNEQSSTYTLKTTGNDGDSYFELPKGGNTMNFKDVGVVVEPKTKASVVNEIKTINAKPFVVREDNFVKNPDDYIKTGDYLVIKSNDNRVLKKTRFVVSGDVNSNSEFDVKDIDLIRKHKLGQFQLSSNEYLSADVDFDGAITVKDMGIIKEKTGKLTKNEYNPQEISLSIQASSVIFKGKEADISLSTTGTNFFIEGYVVFNDGIVRAENDNKRVYFIADDENVYFENGNSSFKITSLVNSGSINFDVEVLNAYDYANKTEIKLDIKTVTSEIKNSEIEISVNKNEEYSVDNESTNFATLQIDNKDDKSLIDLKVHFDGPIRTENNESDYETIGVILNQTIKLPIYLIKETDDGQKDATIEIKYTNSKYEENIIQIPMSINVNGKHCDCRKLKDFKIENDAIHIGNCENCEKQKRTEHRFLKVQKNTFKCVDCGYERKYNVNIERKNLIIDSASTLTPSVMLNNNPVVLQDVKWYEDGTMINNQDIFIHRFKAVGIKVIDFVATTYDGLKITDTIIFCVNPIESGDYNISVEDLRCDGVKLRGKDGYEYAIDGMWQKSTEFTNLEIGKTYKFEQRDAKTKKHLRSTKILIEHDYEIVETFIKCDKNEKIVLKCKKCGTETEREVENTQTNHVLSFKSIVKDATCQQGQQEKWICDYKDCKHEEIITTDTFVQHEFKTYNDDHNATCTDCGTKSAMCEYGCGTKHTVPAQNEVQGHKYVYTKSKNVVIDGNKKIVYKKTCSKCGDSVDVTENDHQTMPVFYVNISVDNSTNAQSGHPNVIADEEKVSVIAKWEKKDEANSVLTEIEIEAKDKWDFVDDVEIFVNGKLFTGHIEIDSTKKTMRIKDVGSFNIQGGK